MESDVYSFLERKRHADNDLNDSAAKKIDLNRHHQSSAHQRPEVIKAFKCDRRLNTEEPCHFQTNQNGHLHQHYHIGFI